MEALKHGPPESQFDRKLPQRRALTAPRAAHRSKAMSVLSFPRIYFQGFMCWDPPTGNNNDEFPTYAYDKAALNWGYLKQFGIDQSNFRTTFRPWVTSEQTYIDGNGKPQVSPPGEWNFFGTNGCYFVQYQDKSQGIDRKSRITGGALALHTPSPQDPLFGKPIELIGDLFGSPEAARPGRLVDNNPASSYSSQIYFNSMRFGDGQTGITGPCYRRMHSRFIGTLRNPNLPSAGHVSVTWQTCFPQKGLVISNTGHSKLLAALQKMIDAGQAKGVMVRFNTYLNLYYQNGYFNGSPKMPHALADTPAMYKQGLATGNQFSNPCYSRVLGVIGPWFNDELVSVPEGRFLATAVPLPVKPNDTSHPMRLTSSMIHGGPPPGLAASAPVPAPNINIPPANPTPVVMLGVTLAEVDYTNHIVSIDALNTFPEWFWQGNKMDLGDVTLAVQDSQGALVTIATLSYKDYDQSSYENGGGILDIKFDPDPKKGLAQKIKDGTLVVRAVAATSPKPTVVNVLVEKPWSAQTDDRGIYLNEGQSKTFDVSVFFKGQRAPNAKLLIAKYAPALTSDPNSYVGAPVLAISANAPQIVNVTNGQTSTVSVTDGKNTIQTNVTVVDVDANGVAHVNISAASAGLPVLMFYPFRAGATPPQPQYEFDNQVPSGLSYYTTIRVLSYDDAFVDEFIQLWNSTFDPAKAWDFIYSNILYLYDMIYPVMLRFVPLGDRQRVEAAIDQVLTLIAPSYFAESTLAMPITRDLSEGKRLVLQLWGGLVKRSYPPQPISKPAPPTA
jgi:hypothetical protein